MEPGLSPAMFHCRPFFVEKQLLKIVGTVMAGLVHRAFAQNTSLSRAGLQDAFYERERMILFEISVVALAVGVRPRLYWILFNSMGAYFLITWANKLLGCKQAAWLGSRIFEGAQQSS